MPSEGFRHLASRLEALIGRFVAFEIPLERNPTVEELDSIACFKLLMHSEIETYIEDRIREVVTYSVNSWRASRSLSRCAFNLLLRWHEDVDVSQFRLSPQIADVTRILEQYARKATIEIQQNNSIKQDAFTRLASHASRGTGILR